MGFGTRLLQFGLAAAAGTGKGLAEHYEAIRQEQEYLAKMREQRALEQWRLGETARMERERMQFQETLPSHVASTKQANTAADENVARANLLGVQATTEPVQRETENIKAKTSAETEARQGRLLGLEEKKFHRENPDRPAGFQEAEAAWLELSAPLEEQGDIVQSYLLGRNTYRLSADQKSPWYSASFANTTELYKAVQKAKLAPKKGDGSSMSTEDAIISLAGGGPAGGDALGADFVGPQQQQPARAYPVGTPGARPIGAASASSGNYSGALGAGPPAGAPVNPSASASSAVPAEPENTAGLSPEEVDYIRGQAQRAGLSFNEARLRLEAKLQ